MCKHNALHVNKIAAVGGSRPNHCDSMNSPITTCQFGAIGSNPNCRLI